MATATRVKPPAPAYDTSDVILTLTSDEAIAVKTLVGAITGVKSAGGVLRKVTDQVWYALGLIGVKSLPASVFANIPVIRPDAEANLTPGFHEYKG